MATSPVSRYWWSLRLLTSALIAAAIVSQLVLTMSIALDATTTWGQHLPTVLANFFSFFTILSNFGAMIIVAIGGIWALRHRRTPTATEPAGFAVTLACVTTYMLVTGVVYNLLLRGVELPQGSTVWWSNEILHVVAPLLLLADLLCAPGRRALPWNTVPVIAAFPIVWAVYTLFRANFITAPSTGNAWWYPYPFLDPRVVGGYGGVAMYVVGIAIAIIGFAAVVIWVGRRRALRPASVPRAKIAA